MFELIAAFFALFSTQEMQPTVLPDAPSAFTGRPVDASEDAIMHVLAEAVLDLYHKSKDNNEPPEQMTYAFMMGVRITLADPGLGQAIQSALMLPKYREGQGIALMDQAAAELRQMIEAHGH